MRLCVRIPCLPRARSRFRERAWRCWSDCIGARRGGDGERRGGGSAVRVRGGVAAVPETPSGDSNERTDVVEGPYPLSLQERVGGDYGHLNNRQAAHFLSTINHERLQHLVAAHLSEKNNDPQLAQAALCEAAPHLASRLTLLEQDVTSRWFSLQKTT